MDALIWFEWAMKGMEGWANHASTLSRDTRFTDAHLLRMEALARQITLIVAKQRDARAKDTN